MLAFRTAVLAAALLAAPALAAPKPVDPSVPAFVNFNRLFAEYQKSSAFGKYQQRLREQVRALEEEMRTLAKLRYSTDAERQEALSLLARGKPGEKEQARIDELTKKADAVDAEFTILSTKMNPSAADSKRLQEITQMRGDAERKLARGQAERQGKLQKLDADLRVEIEAEIVKVVEKVAKENKLPFIYEHRALVFGGTDLTDEVVKKLPK